MAIIGGIMKRGVLHTVYRVHIRPFCKEKVYHIFMTLRGSTMQRGMPQICFSIYVRAFCNEIFCHFCISTDSRKV